ncbi:TIGR01777 family oxidoreductase [Pyxidicoccus trucidator]|uniref:TIGR01777 family oxidoreductase n=1 Tax=Pyxidicoccus trucidator TaxID=2709662 RepID=UPI0013DA878B|nr:TIGR01777 family oxidoreductase [Pyxidicoccus trucidator]
MRIVIPGGTGQVGGVLARAFRARGHDVVILSRGGGDGASRTVPWDGRTVGAWAGELDGADVVINLAGRSVNCRYTAENLRAMMDSRVESTRAVGQAIARAKQPPRLWLQMSTATLYAHRFDAPNDEATGLIGGEEPDAPAYWRQSIDIAKAWERTLAEADTPRTRKVALRTAMVMSADAGGVFDVLLRLVRFRLGGAVAGGRQFVSWIHEDDFVRAVQFLLERDDLEGAFNLAAPRPLPHRDFMKELRAAAGVGPGLPAAKWMLEVGAFFLRTDTELLLKSRRVVPGRLLEAGFTFHFPDWPRAARDLVARWRSLRRPTAAAPAAPASGSSPTDARTPPPPHRS